MASSQHIDNSARNFKNSSKPKIVLLFSGKRKCGKDYITNILYERSQIFNNNITINNRNDFNIKNINNIFY